MEAPTNPIPNLKREFNEMLFHKYHEAIQGVVPEIWSKVFSSVSLETAVTLSRVNKQFYVISTPFAKIAKLAFGRAKWAAYFGDIGQEPPLPPNIHQILTAPCPFWPNKKVEETHMLVLIPSTVNGLPLTVTSLGELVKTPKQGNASKYKYFDLGNYKVKDTPVSKSYWALMTKDVIEGTKSKSYSDQTKIVAGFQQKTGIAYEVPHLIEATVCLFMIHASTGTKLYGDSPWTFTRCQEAYNNDYQLGAGGFAAAGLLVSCDDDYSYVGVGGVRKLC